MSGRAEAKKVHGATILDEVRSAGDGYLRSTRDWDRTIRFFRGVYGRARGIVWRNLETPPKVKAIYIENTRAKRKWDGINIYHHNNRTFIHVLPAKGTETQVKTRSKKKR